MRRYPGGGAFALFFHPHPREFATQNKNSANARGLARGGGGDGRSWNWLMHYFIGNFTLQFSEVYLPHDTPWQIFTLLLTL